MNVLPVPGSVSGLVRCVCASGRLCSAARCGCGAGRLSCATFCACEADSGCGGEVTRVSDSDSDGGDDDDGGDWSVLLEFGCGRTAVEVVNSLGDFLNGSLFGTESGFCALAVFYYLVTAIIFPTFKYPFISLLSMILLHSESD